ncbi:serine/threonine-protein kinase [Tautonia plasticadhaerens]|nr:serine/threonine-protein kinase [Tautonia plasticadhaerens]
MSGSESRSAAVLGLAEEFLDRYRRGERPPLREYIERHPELAAEIREVFPAVALMEKVAIADDSLAGDPTGDAPARAAEAPERLGDYRVLREVGRGGMGVVYEAEQESLGRRVALKVLASPTQADPQQVLRFRREARSAAKLHHTNIVPVFGVGEEAGRQYYVMQFITGLGLDEVLDELKRLRSRGAGAEPAGAGPPTRAGKSAAEVARSLLTGSPDPAGVTATASGAAGRTAASPEAAGGGGGSSSVTLPGEADLSTAAESARRYARSVARIGEQVAEALDYAHAQGTLHRDIKPSNLLLDARGGVWVTDFGLAKAAGDDDLTHTGDLVGTPRYMAPERFAGRCDARADVYALGLTLYELLALRPAFPGADRHDLIRRITQEGPPRLRRLDPAVPRDLATIVHKAIERDPAHRYAAAGSMAEDLRRFLEGRPIRARRVPAPERLARWARRNPWLAGMAAAVLVLLVAIDVVAFALTRRVQAEARRAEETARREVSLRRDVERQKEELLWGNYVNLVNRAYFEVTQNNVARARELLDDCTENLRDFEWHCVRRLCHLAAGTLGEAEQYVMGLAFAPDGSWFVSADGDQFEPGHDDRASLAVCDARSGAVLRSIEVKGSIRRVAVSPDGRRIAYAVGFGNASRPAAGDPTGRVVVCEAETLETRWDAPSPEGTWATDLAIDPEGRWLLVGHAPADYPDDPSPGGASRYDLVTGEATPGFAADVGRGVTAVAIGPDRLTVALAGRGFVEICDATTGERLHVLEPAPDRWVNALAFSPDGTILAAGGFDRTTRLWEVASRRLLAEVPGEGGFIQDLAFSPDGRWLASASESNAVGLIDVASRLRVDEFRGHTAYVLCLAWHPRSDALISGGCDRTILSWDLVTSRPIVKPVSGWVALTGFDPTSPHSRIVTQTPTEAMNDTFTLWDPIDGSPIGPAPIGEPAGPVAGTAEDHVGVAFFDREGRLIASRNGFHAITIREAGTNRVVGRIVGPDDVEIGPATFAHGGRSLITTSKDGTVASWDIATGERHWDTELAGFAHVIPSPDGRRLVASSWEVGRGFLHILDARDGAVIRTLLDRPGELHGIPAFSPDGRRLAVGDWAHERKAIRIFDLETGASTDLEGHTADVYHVAFSPDGRRLASASMDRTVTLWDLGRREPVFALRGHTAGPFNVAFSPDGQLLASTGFDLTVRIWDARPPG